jgi:hypothetical protein
VSVVEVILMVNIQLIKVVVEALAKIRSGKYPPKQPLFVKVRR